MPKLKIIRAAFREIQKLPHDALQNVSEILRRLSQGDNANTKKLQGYDRLRRTRQGNVRVIWQEESSDNLVVIKAGWRDGIYDDAFDQRDRTDPKPLEELAQELLQPSGIPLAETPTYQWNQEVGEAWYKFVYGGYRYSPILTQHQRETLSELIAPLSAPYQGKNTKTAWIVQSAPGTGKTVCATLLACEIRSHNGGNAMLIVPETLREDIAEYTEVKQTLPPENFGTFRDWLSQVAPQLHSQLASPAAELAALQHAAQRARMSSRFPLKPEEISPHDVLLYQAFVLDEANQNQRKNGIFLLYKETGRVDILRQINSEFWQQALTNKLCRLAAAMQLKSQPPPPPKIGDYTLLIVDEAQDFLLAELQALIAVRNVWEKRGHPTYLWLLGDLNQRIQPTDFDWGQLHLGSPIQIERNYRNSRQILQFANQFWKMAQELNARLKGRKLPEPAKPEYASEIGEAVRLLEYSSIEEATDFLKQLAQESGQQENQRYLLRDLANAVKVLSPIKLDPYNNLVVLNPEQAKGREFEACVAFRLFEGEGSPSLEESFQWYTMLTRSRSRLLIVATTEELNRIGNEYFRQCDRMDSQKAIAWITEVASDIDLSQITGDVKRRLLSRCQTGCLYWDTYPALKLADVEGEEIYQWEQEAIAFLQQNSLTHLQVELQKTDSISLQCLLLRAMNCSWQAVEEASNLQTIDGEESTRLLESIARDLEGKNLPYEAARVRLRLGKTEFSIELPFWEEVSQTHQSSPLVPLLCQAFISHLENVLQPQEINE
jgi:mRNA-degrading endonuclease RelE of RelBE toxin-antitoxin system